MYFAMDFSSANSGSLLAALRFALEAILRQAGVPTNNLVSLTVAPGSVVGTAGTNTSSAANAIETALNNGVLCINVSNSVVCATASAPSTATNSQAASSSSSSSMGIIGAAVGGAVGLAMIALIAILVVRRRKSSPSTPNFKDRESQLTMLSTTTTNPLYMMDHQGNTIDRGDYGGDSLYEAPNSKEMSRSALKLGRVIGQGEFGVVYEGLAMGVSGERVRRVAIKVLKTSSGSTERKDFFGEMQIMGYLSNPRVVTLVGVVTIGEPAMIVEEFMANGNLHTFLHRARPLMQSGQLVVTAQRMLQCAADIAEGMSYVASQGIVHRDLAARNVLLDHAHRAKIADFGLARESESSSSTAEPLYMGKCSRKLPIKWMAVESFQSNQFSSFTDVWSFGVTLWEILHLARTPYPGMTIEDVVNKVTKGYRMPTPEFVSGEIGAILASCWNSKAESRPSFKSLYTTLIQLVPVADSHILLSHASFVALLGDSTVDSEGSYYASPQMLVPNYQEVADSHDYEYLLNSTDYSPVMTYDFGQPAESHYADTSLPLYAIGAAPDSNYAQPNANLYALGASGESHYAHTSQQPLYAMGASNESNYASQQPLYAMGATIEGNYATPTTASASQQQPLYALGSEVGVGSAYAQVQKKPQQQQQPKQQQPKQQKRQQQQQPSIKQSNPFYDSGNNNVNALYAHADDNDMAMYAPASAYSEIGNYAAQQAVDENENGDLYDNMGTAGDMLYAPAATVNVVGALLPKPRDYLQIETD